MHIYNRLAVLRRKFRNFANFDDHQRFLSRYQIADPGFIGAIHPLARIVRQQIKHVVDAVVSQRRFAFFAYAFENFNVDRCEIAQRNLARHAGLDLFNTKQIWIQRLSAEMHFARNMWMHLPDMRHEFISHVRTCAVTRDDRQQFTLRRDQFG